MNLQISDTNRAMLGYAKRAALVTGLGLTSLAANAATDYSTLTTAVDWTAVGTALLAVGVAIIGIVVTFKGIKLVVKAVRGA